MILALQLLGLEQAPSKEVCSAERAAAVKVYSKQRAHSTAPGEALSLRRVDCL